MVTVSAWKNFWDDGEGDFLSIQPRIVAEGQLFSEIHGL
ncbi:hypothetical protein SYNPCC7002_A2104 [Picosynechococcus sp. PCC 7002]|nr:hypothetical protein SYNPCC7002_A2104 [Picosynechococcus sp. PCC 7002]